MANNSRKLTARKYNMPKILMHFPIRIQLKAFFWSSRYLMESEKCLFVAVWIVVDFIKIQLDIISIRKINFVMQNILRTWNIKKLKCNANLTVEICMWQTNLSKFNIQRKSCKFSKINPHNKSHILVKSPKMFQTKGKHLIKRFSTVIFTDFQQQLQFI